VLDFRRLPFCLRPERDRQQPWLEVLKQLGIDRGNPGWESGFTAALARRGQEVGIDFDFSVDVGNSFSSLRLLWWAGTAQAGGGHGAQNRLADQLAMAHFEQGMCVCAEETLLAAVVAVGLPEDGARAVLRGRDFEQDVSASIARSHANGHHSIPVFTFEAPHATHEVHGAAGEEEFRDLLQKFAESWPQA